MAIHLTSNEQERIAYMSGNAVLASIFASSQDFEDEVDSFDDQLSAEFSRGYKEGELDTIGKDMDAMLSAQRQEIDRLKTDYRALKAYLEIVQDHLDGEACKKVAGRYALSKDISRRLILTPRY